jgi:hypothetical protein
MTAEDLRKEEQLAIERVEIAFRERQDAFLSWHKKIISFPQIEQDDEILRRYESAEDEWLMADAEMNRIRSEFRSGKRR